LNRLLSELWPYYDKAIAKAVKEAVEPIMNQFKPPGLIKKVEIIDWAIQAHGGGGVCGDFPLAWMYAWNRTLRLADGPDEVHRNQLAKLELRRHAHR
jgi:hypothetical protein